MKLILFCLVLLFLIVPVNAVDWHDDSRLKRVQLNVDNSSVALTDYQIMKTITYDNDMQSDFDDLLFYNESGGTVSYWIESKTDSNTVDIWLKIQSISTTEGAKVWMYYKNLSVGSTSSITDTMVWGDDFSNDLSKWGSQTCSPSITDGILTVDAFNGGRYTSSILGDTLVSHTSITEFRMNNVYTGDGAYAGLSDGHTYAGSAGQDATTTGYDRTPAWWFSSYNDGTGTFDNSGSSPSINTYYNYKLTLISGASVKSEYSGNSKTINTNVPNENMYIVIGGDASFSPTIKMDWIFNRKYTTTEPTWGADGEEESRDAPPPALNGTFLYPNSTYSVGCYGKLISELVYGTGFNFSDIGSCNTLTTGDMEVLSVDDTNYIPSIDKDAAHDGYMYGNFSLPNVESVNFINVKTVHNRNETNPVILGLFNVSTQKWHAVNNSSVEIIDVELTYNITGTDITKYTSLIDNTLNLSVSLNTNGDGNHDVFVDFVEVYIDYEEAPDITLEYVYNLTISNQNNISILQNDVDDLENNVNNLYLFVLLCTMFLIATVLKRRD